MQLRDARLCLDCDEVHADPTCPTCSSETFAFLSRWVPAPDHPRGPRPASSEQADLYRRLLDDSSGGSRRRRLGRSLLGLTALGMAGWAWRSSRTPRPQEEGPPARPGEDPARSA